jgi:hypothetical protein
VAARIEVNDVACRVAYMASLPLEAHVPLMTVMLTIGRGSPHAIPPVPDEPAAIITVAADRVYSTCANEYLCVRTFEHHVHRLSLSHPGFPDALNVAEPFAPDTRLEQS